MNPRVLEQLQWHKWLPRLHNLITVALLCALSIVPLRTVLAAPADALRILQGAGKTGLAQNLNLEQAKKDEVNGILRDTSAKTNAKVYVVMLGRDEDPAAYGELYTTLGMSGKDLLIASNGTKWEVKVAALSHESKQVATERALKIEGLKPIERLKALTGELSTSLAQTQAIVGAKRLSWNEFQMANAGKGWGSSRMSDEYARYKVTGQLSGAAPANSTSMTVTSSPPPPVQRSNTGTWVFLGVVVVAIVSFVVWRRRKRDAGLADELKQALQHPEGVITDLYMNMDGLESNPRFGQLIEAANACQAKLDDLKRGPPTREAVSKARALNDEANRVRRMFDEARMMR